MVNSKRYGVKRKFGCIETQQDMPPEHVRKVRNIIRFPLVIFYTPKEIEGLGLLTPQSDLRYSQLKDIKILRKGIIICSTRTDNLFHKDKQALAFDNLFQMHDGKLWNLSKYGSDVIPPSLSLSYLKKHNFISAWENLFRNYFKTHVQSSGGGGGENGSSSGVNLGAENSGGILVQLATPSLPSRIPVLQVRVNANKLTVYKSNLPPGPIVKLIYEDLPVSHPHYINSSRYIFGRKWRLHSLNFDVLKVQDKRLVRPQFMPKNKYDRDIYHFMTKAMPSFYMGNEYEFWRYKYESKGFGMVLEPKYYSLVKKFHRFIQDDLFLAGMDNVQLIDGASLSAILRKIFGTAVSIECAPKNTRGHFPIKNVHVYYDIRQGASAIPTREAEFLHVQDTDMIAFGI